jgi:hypothetical protein
LFNTTSDETEFSTPGAFAIVDVAQETLQLLLA